MKILQINKYNFIKGGADRVYFNTSNLLEANGHDVISFSTLRPENVNSIYSDYFVPYFEHRDRNSIGNIMISGSYLYNRQAYRNLDLLLEKYRPDVAHLHLFYGDLSSSILKALRKHRIPVVQTVHDYRLLCPANALLDSENKICEKCRDKSYYHCAFKRCLEGNFLFSSVLSAEGYVRKYLIDPLDYIDRFIFVSKFAENKHIEFDQRFATKSEHLYNFTDIATGSAKSDKGNYFLFFGRLSKEKGIETLLSAVAKTEVKLKIAGSGPLQNEIINLSERNDRIEFMGHRSGSDLQELVKDASFIIVPSEWYENNPMTIIESYAAGVPVIASRIGGIPEIVLHEKTGFLFESRDMEGLAAALTHADKITNNLYRSLSTNCREFAHREFSAIAHYDKLMRIFSKVCGHD